eukprot:1880434-Amphidinium_carterae.1
MFAGPRSSWTLRTDISAVRNKRSTWLVKPASSIEEAAEDDAQGSANAMGLEAFLREITYIRLQ